MSFNSVEFCLFLPLVFFAYWSLASSKATHQNLLLLIASYIFYGWWDVRFLGLIFLSSLVDFSVGLAISRTSNLSLRRFLLGLSLVVNLGLLFTFKYFGFFVASLKDAVETLGGSLDLPTLHLILPVGISFYTFQTLSYSIDVYRRTIPACKDPVLFFAYVSFFPQLVAGPIERAANLVPQFQVRRTFDPGRATLGVQFIIWGLFKKVVVADRAGHLADLIFSESSSLDSNLVLGLGMVAFAIQIYGDFSGYSDVAIGVAKLLGIELMLNFAYPYFSRDIAEFWRRWHISLTTWFRDYLYIPLGGSRCGLQVTLRNVFIVFLVSGLWHGANYTFVFWGALNALYFVPQLVSGSNRRFLNSPAQGHLIPRPAEFGRMVWTFMLTCIAWVFFRSESLSQAFSYCYGLMVGWSWSLSGPELYLLGIDTRTLWLFFFSTSVLFLLEWLNRDEPCGLSVARWPVAIRWLLYYSLSTAVLWNFSSDRAFIYFQF